MRGRRTILSVAVAQAAVWVASAAPALAGAPSLNEYSRRLWRMEDGLPQNRIAHCARLRTDTGGSAPPKGWRDSMG
jgi:hypothetical protein